jgi:hypothetical protein
MWKVGETSSPSINGKPGKDKHRGDCQSFLTKIASMTEDCMGSLPNVCMRSLTEKLLNVKH